MSFLGGLGEGFSRSFNAGMERNATQRQDMFRVAYNQYVDKKNQYDKEEKEWKAALSAGESIIARYPNVPREAALQAAKWLRAGYKPEDVERMISETKFSTTPEVEGPAGPDGTPVAAPVSTDQTMQAMDIGISDPTAQPAPAVQKDGGLLNNIFGEQGIFKDAGKSPEEKTRNRLMETMGVTPEEFEQTQRGFSEPPIPSNLRMEAGVGAGGSLQVLKELGLDSGITDAKLAAARATVAAWERSGNPAMQEKARVFNEEIVQSLPTEEGETEGDMTSAQILAAQGRIEEASKEVRGQTVAAADLAKQAKQLDDLAKAEGGSALNSTTSISTFFTSSKNEIANVIDQATRFLNTEGSPNTPPSQSAIMAAVNSVLSNSSLDKISENRKRFIAQQVAFIYTAGRAMGQQGNGFSNYDFDNIMQTVQASNSYTTYTKNIRQLARNISERVDLSLQDAMGALDVQELMRSDPTRAADIQKRFQTMGDRFGNEEWYKWMYEDLDAAPEAASSQEQIDPERVITPEDVAAYPDMLTEQDVGKKFGEVAETESAPQEERVVTEELAKQYPALRSMIGKTYVVLPDGTWGFN